MAMVTDDGDPLSETSLLDLDLEAITAPDDSRECWAAAGRVLVDRMEASMREQREEDEPPMHRRQGTLSDRYEYQFEQQAEKCTEEPQRGL
jgi:hypothetical protein